MSGGNELFRDSRKAGGSCYGEGHWVLCWKTSPDGPTRYRFRTKAEALRFAATLNVVLR